MKIQKLFLFLFFLPITLFLDLIIYSLFKTCPSCGTFSQFLENEGAISFPILVGLMELIGQTINGFSIRKKP